MPSEDRSARARIRDAAIEVFGATGFDAPVRAVAARAGVSPGLLNHHYGSKDGLRQVCDEHVLSRIHELRSDAVTGGPTAALGLLASVEGYAPLTAYVLQALQAGGDLATTFVDHLVADAEDHLAAGVRAGTLRPSRDPAARARYLVHAAVGALLLRSRLRPGATDLPALLRHVADTTTLPALELYTEGLFTDRSMLDEYLAYVPDPPADDPVPSRISTPSGGTPTTEESA